MPGTGKASLRALARCASKRVPWSARLWYAWRESWRRAQTAPVPADEFGEKEFYLDEFHSHTLCFAVTLARLRAAGRFESLGRVLRELIANETRVIVLLGVAEADAICRAELGRVRRRLQRLVLTEETARRFPAVRGRRSASESFVDLSRAPRRRGRSRRVARPCPG